jgi:hypothetical protein
MAIKKKKKLRKGWTLDYCRFDFNSITMVIVVWEFCLAISYIPILAVMAYIGSIKLVKLKSRTNYKAMDKEQLLSELNYKMIRSSGIYWTKREQSFISRFGVTV